MASKPEDQASVGAATAPAAAATKPTPAEKPAATPQAKAEKVEPAFALHQITYGKNLTAVPGSLFTPTSVAERKELVDLEAIRDLTEAEQAVFEKMAAATSDDVIG